jgi:hypothetical protein
MLTATRNICSTIFHYDEHRLGREESMARDSITDVKDGVIKITFIPPKPEPRQVHLSDVYCRGCHQPHTLKLVGEKLLCEFCRRGPVVPRQSLTVRIVNAIGRLIWPRRQSVSIIKLSNTVPGDSATVPRYAAGGRT